VLEKLARFNVGREFSRGSAATQSETDPPAVTLVS
jgi:hypothetical protein